MAAQFPPLGAPSPSATEPRRLDTPIMPNPHPVASPGFAPFSSITPELTGYSLSFLGDQDLRVVDSVSHLFRQEVAGICEERYRNGTFIPESLPPEITRKQFMLNLFPKAIGVDFYRECFGEVDTIPPVPRRFIDMAARPDFNLDFNLALIPEYVTITVDADSLLVLDESTATADGIKKARLIEDPERAPRGQAREIRVPVTLNNCIMLTEKCLKKNLPSQFGGIHEDSWTNVLDQNGDVGVGPSHWSYQKEDVIGLGNPYRSQPDGRMGQVEIAGAEGLEIVPLGDRILFHLATYIQSGKIPQSDHFERTSTVVRSDDGRPWQSAIWWPASGPVFRLDLIHDYDYYDVGAAARVPAGSSQAIGH